MLLAFQTLRDSMRPGANHEGNLVSMQQILACVANYSFFDADAVVACGAPQLLVSVFATDEAPGAASSWRLTQPVLRDERLHELALMALYNLRSRPEVLLLLADSKCREALEQAAARLGQAAKCREVFKCLDSFDGGKEHHSAPVPPMVVMQVQVPPGATAGSKVTFMTPKGPLEVEVPAGYSEGTIFPLEFEMCPTVVTLAAVVPDTSTAANMGPVRPTAAAAGDARLCPLTQQLMEDPYWCSDGVTYERSALVHMLWQLELEGQPLCSPTTDLPLKHCRLLPDTETRQLIASRVSTRCQLDPEELTMSDH
eukprot:4873051-Prymnesium_polylepis.1